MLRMVLEMVGVTHVSRVVEICYVDSRRTIGDSRVSIRGYFPSGSFL